MKRILTVFIALFVLGAAPSGATRPPKRHSDAKMLEASLQGLKESCEAIAERNERLLSDIASYAQNIGSLRQELKNLEETKTGLLEGYSRMKGEGVSAESEKFLRSEIDRLSKELGSVSQDKVERAFRSRRDALMSSIEKDQEGIKDKEADLKKVSRQYDVPLRRIGLLTAEQARLKTKVEKLQNELKEKLGESAETGQLSSHKDKKNEDRLSQLNSDLVRLRLRRQKLTKDILRDVQGAASGNTGHEGDLWEKRINALKDENAMLQQEIMAIRGL